MNHWLAIPLELRLMAMVAAGGLAGALVNFCAALLAQPRPVVHPWLTPVGGGAWRRWLARLPVMGWLVLRGDASLKHHRPGLRPMVVELVAAAGFAWLYWWEIGRLGLVPPPLADDMPTWWMAAAHAQLAAHLVLVVLMLVASLIDMDEKIIPDAVTVPGTLAGLAIAAAFPLSRLPEVLPLPGGFASFDFLHIASPNPWPQGLEGAPQTAALALGVACLWAWCLALVPRTWYARHGWRRAAALCCARVCRDRGTLWVGLMGLAGAALIYGVWLGGGASWRALLCALVGMAVSGGLIWVVRVIGFLTLRREAMGFGDVTLMAMIGAFLGWQPCLIIFFIAPLAGLLVGVLQLVAHRDNEIPYGPFLCLAALVVIVRWAAIWDWALGIFALGSLVPLILAACMVLMAILLLAMRALRALLGW